MANHGEVQLGDLVKDEITGYKGIAVSMTTWLNGCRRIGIQSRALEKEGRVQPTEVFDEIQLTVLERRAFVGDNTPRSEHSPARSKTGGPLRDEERLLARD